MHPTEKLIQAVKDKPSLATANREWLKSKFNLTDKDLVSLKGFLKNANRAYRNKEENLDDNFNAKIGFNSSITLKEDESIKDFTPKVDTEKLKVASYKEWTNAKGEKQYQIVYDNPEEDENNNSLLESIEDIMDKKLKNVKPIIIKPTVNNVGLFDRLVFTDIHIGMDVSDKVNPIYDLEWNKDILISRIDKMIKLTIQNKKSSTLFINDLGDTLDATLEGRTTRGGHSLPQNMSSVESFDTLLDIKLDMLNKLVPHYSNIYLVNVTNSNHDGDFSLVAHKALKRLVEKIYPNVTVHNQEKFVESYQMFNYKFVLTHGKDSKFMKFGLPVKLNPMNASRITNMLVQLGLFKDDHSNIEFSKGDSHQYLIDECTSDLFTYANYPAFSNSSSWVQHNFNKGKSGFVFYNYYEDYKTTIPYFFK